MAGAYAVFFTVNKAINVNAPIAAAGSASGDPMEFMSRIIMQTRSIVSSGTVQSPLATSVPVPSGAPQNPTDYGLAVSTDRIPFNGSWELNYFHVDASAPLRVEVISRADAQPVRGAARG